MSTVQINILDETTARKALLVARAYSHPIRLKQLELLAQKGKMAASDFYSLPDCINHIGMRMEQSINSQHLAILRNAGLVDTERVGKNIFYWLSDNIHVANHAISDISDIALAA